MIVQKTAGMMFFLKRRLAGLKNTRTFVLKEKEPFFDTLPKKSSANSIYNIYVRAREGTWPPKHYQCPDAKIDNLKAIGLIIVWRTLYEGLFTGTKISPVRKILFANWRNNFTQ